MRAEHTFSFPLAQGLHARPASALRQRAQSLGRFTLVNERSGQRADLADLLALLGTDTRCGDPCRILAEGPGAEAALGALARYLEGAFLDCDPPATLPTAHLGTVLPALLARTGGTAWAGLAVAPGVGLGPALPLRGRLRTGQPPVVSDPDRERVALGAALQRLGARLRAEAASLQGVQRGVLEAHAGMLEDRTWIAAMEHQVRAGVASATAALSVAAETAAALRGSANPYLRERALDIEGLGEQLHQELTGAPEVDLELPGPVILVAAALTPSRFLALDRTRLLGLVLSEGGGTSHTAILARSFGIPCVAGLSPRVRAGRTLLVDGGRGLVIPEPPAEILAYYRAEAGDAASEPEEAQAGPALVLRCNILAAQEAPLAHQAGAQGIGLFRTEMLFLERNAAPDEEEQFQAYRQALRATPGQPLVLRLLDVGGDKDVPYLNLPREANPYLGLRGVRCYARNAELIRTQLRAALRAGLDGDLRLMIPMVSELEEIRAVRGLIAESRAQLADRGIPGRAEVPLGIMVEVPAAVLNLDALAQEADFLCVGSNDLVQYLFAADRGDPTVAKAEHDWHPATLRALSLVLAAGQRQRVPVSLCGELAGRPELLPLLVGLGFRELSMAPALLPGLRATLAGLDEPACRALAEQALGAGTAAEVQGLLRRFATQARGGPLLHPGLVRLDCACQSKEEAIQLLVQRLAGQGRTRQPRVLEEAVWARERTYATGVGHGFAIPHCKCPGTTPSLAVLRLREGLAWGGLDDQPVDLVLLLAMGAEDGDQHLRVFARLARKLVDPAFRDALRGAAQAEDLLALVQPCLS